MRQNKGGRESHSLCQNITNLDRMEILKVNGFFEATKRTNNFKMRPLLIKGDSAKGLPPLF
ncbi:MAG: hypothetical protein ACFFDN_14005 [Candidatus Hodarchaeota archaeon]